MENEKKRSEAPSAAQKILVIDDESAYRDIITIALQTSGYEVFEAADGAQGLAAAKKHHPDLILCDINMPKMDGHALLNALKAEREFAGIPFIFLTGNAAQSDMRKGMQLGADDYITKPFTGEELLAAVQTRLAKKRSLQKYFESQYDEIKSSIVKSLPHEFRTPLNGILGFSQVLLEENDMPPEEVRKIAAHIFKAGERLHHLLENMILYGQIQVWRNDPEKVAHLRRDEIASLADILQPVVQKGMEAHNRPGAVEVVFKNAILQISTMHLMKVVEEVVDNALKFSEQGTTVTVATEDSGTAVHIVVRDEGRGMSEEQLRAISAFHQFERGYYEQQGAGLGLVIATALAELYGGNIAIASAEQKGTTVTVTLPKAK